MTGLLLPSVLMALAALGLRRSFASFRFAWWELVVVAFGIELVLYNPPINSLSVAIAYGPWVWVATRLALLLAALHNARPRTAGFLPSLVVAVGLGLNTLVVVANGGYMPQSRGAAESIWGPIASSTELNPDRLQNTRPMDASSRLAWLGDILPEPTWLPRANVLSIGDVVLALGMAGWIFASSSRVATAGDDSHGRAATDIELDKDVLDVRFNRLHGHHQALGDHAI